MGIAMSLEILTDLQTLLRARGYDAYLVPRADACFGEEVRGCDERLRAISGFGGSAGVAVVRASGESLLLVDGRYSTSARELLDGAPWQVLEGSLALAQEGLEGRRLAYDPWLFTPDQLAVLANVNLVAEPENLVDLVWPCSPQSKRDQPAGWAS